MVKRYWIFAAVIAIGVLLVSLLYFGNKVTEEKALEIAANAKHPDGISVFSEDPRTLRKCTGEFPTIKDPCVSVEYSEYGVTAQWHVFVGCGPLCGNGVLIDAHTGQITGFSVS